MRFYRSMQWKRLSISPREQAINRDQILPWQPRSLEVTLVQNRASWNRPGGKVVKLVKIKAFVIFTAPASVDAVKYLIS